MDSRSNAAGAQEELYAAVRDFIENSPIGDDDKPYCSDVMQSEFRRLFEAYRATPASGSEWQPIETAPYGKVVLLWKTRTSEHYVACKVDGGNGPGWCTPDGFEIFGATDWMTLPKPPSSSSDAKRNGSSP